MLDEQFPDWAAFAETAARENGREAWWLGQHGPASSFTADMLELLEYSGAQPDTEAIARRAAGDLAGRPLPAWEYVAVDVSVPLTNVPMFDGWQLCSADRAADPELPMAYDDIIGQNWSPELLHQRRFGALRRPRTAHTLNERNPSGHDLVWPLMALNLLDAPAVRAFTAYLVEPGRSIITLPGQIHEYLPAEVASWHQQALSLLPAKPQALDPAIANNLERYATEIGSCITALSDSDRQIFARASGHHLYLAYHQGPKQPELDASYVAFRRTVTIEALLAGTDRDHESIARKVAQRAAILAGRDDDDRVAAHNLVKAAYGARSAFAHGSGKPKQVDHARLTHMVRTTMRHWLALASVYGATKIAPLLDEALLSNTTREDLLRVITEHERRAGIG